MWAYMGLIYARKVIVVVRCGRWIDMVERRGTGRKRDRAFSGLSKTSVSVMGLA